MKPILKSTLFFSLNNNNNCSVLDQVISNRIIFTKKGLLSQDKEILVLLTNNCFVYDSEHEVYGHVVKYINDSWCSCLIFTHKSLDRNLQQKDFLNQYYKEIIINGNWSPMNSVIKNDVFIESNSFDEAVKNLNQLIKHFSKNKHIPVSPDPIDEMNGMAVVQKGDCDFRPLNLYGINLACC